MCSCAVCTSEFAQYALCDVCHGRRENMPQTIRKAHQPFWIFYDRKDIWLPLNASVFIRYERHSSTVIFSTAETCDDSENAYARHTDLISTFDQHSPSNCVPRNATSRQFWTLLRIITECWLEHYTVEVLVWRIIPCFCPCTWIAGTEITNSHFRITFSASWICVQFYSFRYECVVCGVCFLLMLMYCRCRLPYEWICTLSSQTVM